MLELTYKQNTFSFEFAALDYAMPARNRYAFRLEGFEKEWRYVDANQRSGMYTNLDPGEYLLHVKGSNGDGVWNNVGTSVKIFIHPPFWMTWYFRGGFGGFVFLFALTFYTYRIRKIAKQNIDLESKVKERTRQLHQSNEELNLYKNNLEAQVKERTLELQRTVLSLETEVESRERIQKELLIYQKDLQHLASELSSSEERERRRVAAFLHDVVSQTLFFCKMKLGSLKEDNPSKKLEEIHILIEDMLNQVQSLTFDLSPPILYELGLDEAISWLVDQLMKIHRTQIIFHRAVSAVKLSDDMRFVIFTATRELLTNSIKHANASKIEISLEIWKSNMVLLSVSDNGCGFDPDTRLGTIAHRENDNSGFGLFNVKERLTYLGGKVVIDSKIGTGTTVTISLPLNGH